MRSFSILLASLLCGSFLQAAPAGPQIKAKIFDKEGKDLLFNYEHYREDIGPKISVKNVFKSTDGKDAVVETVVFENRKLKTYEIDQKQINAVGKVEVRDGKVFFSYTEDGKTKADDEKLKENFVVGPSLVPYLQEHWAQIKAGESLDVRLGVVDRRETVGFTLKKMSESTFEGKKSLVLRMKPTSFVIAAIVSPLQFTFTEDGTKLLEIRGRAIPKRQIDGKFKDLDGLTLYEHLN